jgi:hypothetical protein
MLRRFAVKVLVVLLRPLAWISTRAACLFNSWIDKLTAKPCFGQMAFPIRKAIDYQSVGRKLLAVEELPQSPALICYGSTLDESEKTEKPQ